MARRSSMPKGIEQKLIEFVEQGLTDAAIGRRLGRKGSTITAWRYKLFISKGSRMDWAQRFSLTN